MDQDDDFSDVEIIPVSDEDEAGGSNSTYISSRLNLSVDDRRLIKVANRYPCLFRKLASSFNDPEAKERAWSLLSHNLNRSVEDIQAQLQIIRGKYLTVKRSDSAAFLFGEADETNQVEENFAHVSDQQDVGNLFGQITDETVGEPNGESEGQTSGEIDDQTSRELDDQSIQESDVLVTAECSDNFTESPDDQITEELEYQASAEQNIPPTIPELDLLGTRETNVKVTELEVPVTAFDVPVTELDVPIAELEVPVTVFDVPVTELKVPVTEFDALVKELDVSLTELDVTVTGEQTYGEPNCKVPGEREAQRKRKFEMHEMSQDVTDESKTDEIVDAFIKSVVSRVKKLKPNLINIVQTKTLQYIDELEKGNATSDISRRQSLP